MKKSLLVFFLFLTCLFVNSNQNMPKSKLEMDPEEPCASPVGWCIEI